MARNLILPVDFHQYAWEVEAKGVFWDAQVDVDGVRVPVTFYDPTRFAQDVAADLADGRVFLAKRVLIVDSLTTENMNAAVATAPEEFFA